jgi:hypothetical protein
MYNKITKSIMIISFLGIIVGVWLISKDLKNPGFCPKLSIIPACYLVVIAFFLVYASAYIIKKKTYNALFFTGDGLGLILAIWFSISQVFGLQECPKLFGLSLCYISFFTFLLLLGLHLIRVFLNKE